MNNVDWCIKSTKLVNCT